MIHQALVKSINKKQWECYSPQKIIYLSLRSAEEFAESLRCAEHAYPNHSQLSEMIKGELQTDNLSYEDYAQVGDHWQFLKHFCVQHKINEESVGSELVHAGNTYVTSVRKLGDDNVRAMTVFSRDQELPGIFKKILKAHDWEKLGLGFYKYYLERHIEIDSKEGGHAGLTKSFDLDEKILFHFYTARLHMYNALRLV